MGNRDFSLGEFEELVLIAVARLGDNAYGVTILREITEVGKRFASIGAVYTTLDRLDEKGYVTARVGQPTKERGGRAKKYYEIEGAGRYALEAAELTRERLRGIVGMAQLPKEGLTT